MVVPLHSNYVARKKDKTILSILQSRNDVTVFVFTPFL